MQTTLTILTIVSAVFIILLLFLWTYMRFQRIVHNKKREDWQQKLWYVLLILSLVFIFAATTVFFVK